MSDFLAAERGATRQRALRAWKKLKKLDLPKNYRSWVRLNLSKQTYISLRAEAERTGVPATTLAREAVDSWLRQQGRRARHDAIAAYAAEMSGTRFDLDTALESAAVEHILNTSKAIR